MGTTLSSIAGALKQIYDDYVEKQQNLSHKSIDEIASAFEKYNAGGQGFYGAANFSGNESIGAINETQSFNTIGNEYYIQFKVSPKVLVAPVEFSGLSAAAADSDEEAFVNVVIDALEMARERLLKDENRQFFGRGNGFMAYVSVACASTATSFTVDNSQYFRANMVIDIYNGATLQVTAITISEVDRVNNILYMAKSLGATSDTTHEIVKQNIRVSAATDGKEMIGLDGIIDDSTLATTFENINALTNLIWRGRRIDASSANLTSDLLQRLLDDIMLLGGEEADLIIMHPKQRRKYLDLVVPQKRYMDGKMDAGFTSLTFNGIELFLDVDCQSTIVYAGKKGLLRKFEVDPLKMGTYEGSDKFLRATDYDKFQAYWRHYANFGTSKRNAFGKIVSLAVPTGVA